MDSNKTPRLGIDIGRVIIDGSSHPDGGDTAFFQGDEAVMLRTPEMDGAFDAIRQLVDVFDGNVWLVSKCGTRVQERTSRWLEHHQFPERTGVALDNRRYCRERSQKRGICAELEITHFVDDHPDVHRAIRGVVAHQYLFGPQRHEIPDYVEWTQSWADVLTAIGTAASV